MLTNTCITTVCVHCLNVPSQVGSGVLIGAGAVLLGGITVGDGAQIGACSMVLADIPAGCVAVGVPAKVLGKSKVKNPAASMQQVCTH